MNDTRDTALMASVQILNMEIGIEWCRNDHQKIALAGSPLLLTSLRMTVPTVYIHSILGNQYMMMFQCHMRKFHLFVFVLSEQQVTFRSSSINMFVIVIFHYITLDVTIFPYFAM